MVGPKIRENDSAGCILALDGNKAFHIPKEYVCGGIASMVNVVVVFPLHKTVFFQQLEGVKWTAAFSRLKREGISHVYRGVVPPLLQRAASASVMFGFQSQSQRFLYRHQGMMELPPQMNTIISATLAGCLETFLTPFERVQTLIQASNSPHLYKNTSQALSSLYKTYGLRELYRGLSPILLRNCIGNILYFTGKDWFYRRSYSQDFSVGRRHLTDFIIGGFLGSTIGAVIFPFNVVKAQMQFSVGSQYTSLRSTLRTLINEREHKKFARLYSGLPVNFFRSLISWGVITMVYEWLMAL